MSDLRKRNLLVVDDDPAFAAATARRLTHAGYCVRAAGSGDAALRLLQHNAFDAVLLDVHLGGHIDGLDVANSIREAPETARTPIIFITGAADEDFKTRTQAVGAKYFVSKPYDPDLLLQTLRNVFAADELAELKQLSAVKRRQPVSPPRG